MPKPGVVFGTVIMIIFPELVSIFSYLSLLSSYSSNIVHSSALRLDIVFVFQIY